MPDFHDSQRTVPTMEHYRGLDKEALTKIGDEAVKLLSSEKDGDRFINNVGGVLIGTLQLYQIARAALSRRCVELKVSEEVEGWIAASMQNHAGNEEFGRKDVLDKVNKLILPFVMAEYQAEGEREQEAEVGEAKEEDAARRKGGITLPFVMSPWWKLHQAADPGYDVLMRERPMVVTGDPGAVVFFLDMIQRHCLTRKSGEMRPNVLRLIERLEHKNVLHAKGEGKQYFEVGASRWLNCGANANKIAKTLNPWLKLLRKQRVDVLIVEEFAQFVGGSDRLPPQQRAGVGLRALSRWAERVGCATIVAVPLVREEAKPVELPELDKTWSNLEVYSDLIQVGVEENDDETYRLFAQAAGKPETREVVEPEIDKGIIDNWRKSDNTDS